MRRVVESLVLFGVASGRETLRREVWLAAELGDPRGNLIHMELLVVLQAS
jgi:hypothetical protein